MFSPPRLYPTDLTDAEWAILEPLIPAPKPGGRPPQWTRRVILDGIFYLVRSGCHWRLLPREYPPWKTVYHYFRAWRIDGTWKRLNATLRERERTRQGRNREPSGCIMDSQSARTTSVGGIRGYDGGKKLSGRKRHLLVDTLGLVLTVTVHAADLQDRAAVPQVLQGVKDRFGRLAHIWLDQGYTGAGRAWIERELGWSVEIVKHAPRPRGMWVFPGQEVDPTIFQRPTGFRHLPRRWVVERTQPDYVRDGLLDRAATGPHDRGDRAAAIGCFGRAATECRSHIGRGRRPKMSSRVVVSVPPRLRAGTISAGGSSCHRRIASG